MKKTFESLTKKKLLGVLALFAVLSGTMVASVPNVAADATSSILTIVKNIQTIVQSIRTTVQSTNTNLNKVKVETVIISPPMNTSDSGGAFNLTANQPWDLLAVYVTTNGLGTVQFGNTTQTTSLLFGNYRIGGRNSLGSHQTFLEIAGHDVTDYPIFAGDIMNVTESFIAIPANVTFSFSWLFIVYPPPEGFLLTYKIVFQKPIDPSFNYTVTWKT